MKKDFMYAKKINNKDKQENETSIYVHPLVENKDWSEFYKPKTIHDNFKNLLEDPEFQLLGYRKRENGKLAKKFTFLSVREIFEKAEAIGSGLKNLGLINEICEWNDMNFKFMGMYGKNTLNYFLSDIALCIYGITIIPLYDTLGEEAINYTFEQTKMETLFINANHIKKMLEQKKEKNLFKSLKNIIVLDEENFDSKIKTEYGALVKIFTLSELMKKGEENIQPWAKVTPETIYSFSYTSGTTGTPKGAMLSHNNICSTIWASQYIGAAIKKGDVYLSYLPMAHVMERAVFHCGLVFKVKIGIYSGDIATLFEDIKLLKPTFFVSVPRIFNKIYDKIKKEFDQLTGFKKWLIDKAMTKKLNNLKNKNKFDHKFYDFLVFKKIRKILGGNIRILATGSAPIHIDVLNFFKIAFRCPFVEGYGQTEGFGFEFGTREIDLTSGHVGGPVPCMKFKLVDVPEMNYTSLDTNDKNENTPRGEIWVRGTNIIPGYYKLDEKNKETFSDGWLKSGDIGIILPYKNALKIIDRKKNIFKLSQGEYIAPEKLENIYKTTSSLIGDIYVYGDSFKSCLVAAINIDSNDIKILAKKLNIEFEKNEDLSQKKEFIDALLKIFLEKNKEYELNSLEKLKGLVIDVVPWADNGLITTTMKKKRNSLKNFYMTKFDKLYEKLY